MDIMKQQIKEKVRENSKALAYEQIKFPLLPRHGHVRP